MEVEEVCYELMNNDYDDEGDFRLWCSREFTKMNGSSGWICWVCFGMF